MKSERDFANKDQYVQYLRAYFAAASLSSLADTDDSPEEIARTAVDIADAVIAKMFPKE